jgi:excisionase family DNA binding protein
MPSIKQPAQQPLTMTVEEAAAALGIGRTSAYAAIARGELPCIRIGRRVVVPRPAMERLLTVAADVSTQGERACELRSR